MNPRRVVCALTGLAVAMVAVVVGLQALGVRWVTTESVATGVYRVVDRPPKVGDVVQTCAPIQERVTFLKWGPCPGGNVPIAKRVVAMEGDRVGWRDGQVLINGQLLPASARLPSVQLNVMWQVDEVAKRSRVLAAGELWLYGDLTPAQSFDSRYFGVARMPVTVLEKVGRDEL